MDKSFLYRTIFESINDWNIITLSTTSKNSTDKDDEAFGILFRRVTTRMSEKY